MACCENSSAGGSLAGSPVRCGDRRLHRVDGRFSRAQHRLAGFFMPTHHDQHETEGAIGLRVAGIHGDGFSKSVSAAGQSQSSQ